MQATAADKTITTVSLLPDTGKRVHKVSLILNILCHWISDTPSIFCSEVYLIAWPPERLLNA